jgi:hypothetical protein
VETAIRDAAQAILAAEAILDTKIGHFNEILPGLISQLRKDVANLKTSKGWDDGKGNVL